MKTMSVVQVLIWFVNPKLSKAMRGPCYGGRAFIITSLLMVGLWLGVMAAVITTSWTAAAQSVQFEEIGGTLPDGTEFLIRVPQNWNGTVINDPTTHNHPTPRSVCIGSARDTLLRVPSAILCGDSSMIRWVRSRTK